MHFLALNLILAIIWLFLTGSFTTANLLFGLVVGFAVLALGQPYLGSGGYITSVRNAFRLLRIFLKEIAVANVQLARDLLRPKLPFVPGFIQFDTEGRLTTAELALLANMISLTPGTLSMDTDESGRVLYIHSVYAGDPESQRAGFREFVELIERVRTPGSRRAEVEG